ACPAPRSLITDRRRHNWPSATSPVKMPPNTALFTPLAGLGRSCHRLHQLGAVSMELTTEMLWVLGFLAFTIYLFVSEIVRVDVAAILVMVLLGLTTVLP